MSEPTQPNSDVRWLSPDELATWRAVSELLGRLPAAMGNQLQCDSGLSVVEYYTMAGISEQPDRTIRMSRLAVLAHSELSRLSHLVARLERRGFVRREPDPTDGRFTNAILTDAGFDYLVEAAPAHVEHVRSLVFDALDTSAQHALRDASRQILARIDAPPRCSDDGSR